MLAFAKLVSEKSYYSLNLHFFDQFKKSLKLKNIFNHLCSFCLFNELLDYILQGLTDFFVGIDCPICSWNWGLKWQKWVCQFSKHFFLHSQCLLPNFSQFGRNIWSREIFSFSEMYISEEPIRRDTVKRWGKNQEDIIWNENELLNYLFYYF